MKQVIFELQQTIVPVDQIDEKKYFLLKGAGTFYVLVGEESSYIFRNCREPQYHWCGYSGSKAKTVQAAYMANSNIEVYQFDSFFELANYLVKESSK